MAKTKKPPVQLGRSEKYTSSLRVDLTAAEVADRADRAAAKLAERDAKDNEQKAAAQHMKGVIKEVEAELRNLSHEVRTRSTYRMTECERTWDYKKGLLREVRLDTGEVLCERPLTDAEKQMPLPFNVLDGDGEVD